MTYTAIRRAAFAALAILALAACETTLSLDTENLQNLIKQGLEAQNVGLTVSSVTCPERPLQQGDKFDCTATTSDGQTVTIAVEQTDAAGNVHWEVKNP